jgi:hypothetical protein
MSRGTVISLCDVTGNMVEPWLEAGYEAITFDIQPASNLRDGRRHMIRDVRDIVPYYAVAVHAAAVFAFPPCTNVAVSGARWFREKGLDGLMEALGILNACKKICEAGTAPWMIENPVSTFSTYWREPDYTFHPADYTGFELGDNYTKKTCLWTGNRFVMPDPRMATTLAPDDRIHKAPPGPERANFRSATPMGFARAVFLANAPHLRELEGAVTSHHQTKGE